MKTTILTKLSYPVMAGTMSFVIALSAPIGTANAQMSAQNSLTQLKQKITTQIDTNIQRLQQTQRSLELSITANKDGISGGVNANGNNASGSIGRDGATGSVNGSRGGSASGSVNKDGATGSVNGSRGGSASGSISIADGLIYSGSVSVSPELLTKLKDSNQKAIDKLSELKEKVESQNVLAEVRVTAQEFEQQSRDFAAAYVQAAVTKSIDSATKVLDQLQLVANNLQTQINKLKQCIQSVSVDANVSAGNGSASGSVNASAPGCSELNVDLNSGDAAASLQAKLDEIKSSMQTIRSFLSSSINLVTTLKEENYTGTIASVHAVATVLDLVVSMSATVQQDLANLSISVNK